MSSSLFDVARGRRLARAECYDKCVDAGGMRICRVGALRARLRESNALNWLGVVFIMLHTMENLSRPRSPLYDMILPQKFVKSAVSVNPGYKFSFDNRIANNRLMSFNNSGERRSYSV